MSTLWLPPSEHQRVLDQRARYAVEMAHGMARATNAKEIDRDLKRIDPYLELVQAHETANHPQLTPGYYHVIRHNPGTAPTVVLAVKGPAGEFREPDSQVFEELAKIDAWSDRSRKEQERRRADAERTARSRKKREREERVDEVWHRIKSAHTPSVSMSPGWSNTVAGKRGRKAA